MKKLSCNSYAVIGLGFGDEGKGVTVNSLCHSLSNPLVIRYSGGQQAGHTVTLENGISHTFASFGSGSLKDIPTYWSKYCTFDPISFDKEANVLIKKGFKPTVYIDKKSPVTTPYDIVYNQKNLSTRGHGTCGAGVGATFEREANQYSLLAGDILFESVLKAKLELIREYYKLDVKKTVWFLECCNMLRYSKRFIFVDEMPKGFINIFEGSQGLLLDQNIGFFPHVTRSNTGTRNILEMGHEPYLYLITRAYQTRHGNGPMTNLNLPHNIKDNPFETNTYNDFQGNFRKSLLDLDLLKYGIERDDYIRKTENKELVITCMDLVKDELRYTIGGKIVNHLNYSDFASSIAKYLGIKKVNIITSPFGRLE